MARHKKVLMLIIIVAATASLYYMLQNYIPVHQKNASIEEIEIANSAMMEGQDDIVIPEPTPSVSEQNYDLITLTTAQEFLALQDEKKPYVLMFHTQWCPACQMAKAGMPEVVAHFKGSIPIYSIDLENESISEALEKSAFLNEPIRSIPTFVFVHNENNVKDVKTGYSQKDSMIEHIKTVFNMH